MNFYLGIDFGTSGARGIVIDATAEIVAKSDYSFAAESQDIAGNWQTALYDLIEQIPLKLRAQICAIAIDGTSSTVLLCDRAGIPIDQPILYNDGRGVAVLEKLNAIAPPHHPVISATSSFAKLLWWFSPETTPFVPQNLPTPPQFFLHQADWLAFLLHGKLGISDYHNALKLGYDPEIFNYPDWLKNELNNLPLSANCRLPEVVKPGQPIGQITPEISQRFQLPPHCVVCAGTTDSIAAFLASGAQFPGEAVTSLGSTLVLKLLSRDRIDDARFGIYSHRLGDLWLTGGASNTGGAVLRQFFSDPDLENFSTQIDPQNVSLLDYYPLTKPGDRFPINDPQLPPRLEPKPDNPVEFLHGLLESLARIEAQGYQLLQQLAATPLTRVYTAGGGAKNSIWTQIRARHLQVPVMRSPQTEAAYGTALLAMRGVKS